MTSDDIITLIKKQPIGFGCSLLSLIVGGMLYFQTSRIEDNQNEFETKSAEAARLISNVNSAKNLPDHVKEIQAQTKEMESRLIGAGQLAVNLQYFYKLEAENDVKLLDVRPNSAPKTGTPYVGVPFSVSVQGSYKQIMIFLNHLENGRHFCHFSSFIFGKVSSADSSQTVMTLTLNLELFGRP